MNERIFPGLGEKIYEDTLPNGLRIKVVPKRGFARSYAFFATDYGSMDTRFRLDGKDYVSPDGVAHYLEHKMFDMPDGNALQKMSQTGASPNAFTSYNITAYHFSCTSMFEENFRTLLQFVSQGYFTQESVEKERGIIAQEAKEQGIHGKATTPFLLAKVKELTGGDSLDSNIQLVYNNAALAAKTACELCKMD